MLIRGQPAEHDCGGWLDRPAWVGADYQTLYRELGITADAVAAAERDSIRDAEHGTSLVVTRPPVPRTQEAPPTVPPQWDGPPSTYSGRLLNDQRRRP